MVQPGLVEELAGQCSNFVQQCIRLMDSGVTEDWGGLMVVTDGLEGKKKPSEEMQWSVRTHVVVEI